MKTHAQKLTLTALFVALIAILSQIQLPLPYVPINLALIAVYLAGAMLPFPWGATATVAYMGLGALGVPVFAGMQGGVGVLFGRTGGFIIGYILVTVIVGFVTKKGAPHWRMPLACILGTLVLYLTGTVWFMVITKLTFQVALSYCVLPFLIGDAIKIAVSTALYRRLKLFHR